MVAGSIDALMLALKVLLLQPDGVVSPVPIQLSFSWLLLLKNLTWLLLMVAFVQTAPRCPHIYKPMLVNDCDLA